MPFFFIDHNGLKHPSNQLWEYFGIKDPEAGQPAELRLRQQRNDSHPNPNDSTSNTETNRELLAKDIMTAPVVTIFEDQKLQDAVNEFVKYNFRHLPVISHHGTLVGLLSERDIIRRLHQNPTQTCATFLQTPVNVLMEKTVLTVSQDTELQYVIDSMRYESVGSLPVLGDALSSGIAALPRTAEIVGIITKSNLLPLNIS